MGFQLSPGVSITETDLTTIVPAVATTAAAFCGKFQWGPVDEICLITKENQLRTKFGLPVDENAIDWMTAASFLSYGNNLQVVRTFDQGLGMANASDAGSDSTSGDNQIHNETHYLSKSAASLQTNFGTFAAKYPGELGNSIRVVILDNEDAAENSTHASASEFDTFIAEFDAEPGTSDQVKAITGREVFDEIHILVLDANGAWTGTKDSVLERFAFVSKASNATKSDGTSNFYKDVVNKTSEYIWFTGHLDVVTAAEVQDDGTAWGTEVDASTVRFKCIKDSYYSTTLSGGDANLDGTTGADAIDAFNKHFANAEVTDVSLLITGDMDATQQQSIVDIADERKDCIAFLSCRESTGAHDVINLEDCTTHKTTLGRSSSYAVLDSGWKYMYDRYNDTFRYVPLNGDVAGCVVQTDEDNEPWFSPAGFSRGRIRNVTKLPFNPNKTERDTLYKNGINPVVTFEGEGTVLFGDKTLLSRPSAFDRINVRRLFIVIEKAIATAAKFSLFEFNDFFTRQQFKSMVEPFLRDVQSRRGLTDFKVICDETNNTPAVIDSNRFVADIFIKPNRAINFIQLNFIATPTGLDFEEIGG
tara:strand:+ start:426 stop:2192 length:1767 start_codon:yes stop_codon:yes gene_type:complete